MIQILIFVYALIIFISLFLVVTTHIPCVHHDDCPKRPYPRFMKCVDNFCETWIIGWE
ncbi:Nodule Cysteine-Rich (NCR) secreted peptide [Medicago truncatula]|uniref:Nodule Cysteine-Rich (NCR) secreted peptide n=1 Tax=Medicago truncatula TaxID=3880 RepID=A0A072VX14_MEDTR|nr:Nodule Cysteine-Rich (NCR) secreted peptide [Medicago truncatula]